MRVVFKNMVVHPQVMNAHLAGCAAGRQKKFQQFKAAFWEKGFKARKMDDASIEEIAKGVGLDMARFKTDKDSEYCKNLIQGDMAELQKFRVNSTPSFFVRRGSGELRPLEISDLTPDAFAAALDQALAAR